MHLATALDRPVVAIIGPTRPELTGPSGAKPGSSGNRFRAAPAGEKLRNCPEITCMKAIEVADVLEAVRSVHGFH